MAIKIDVTNYRKWEEERYGHTIEEQERGKFRLNVFGQENTPNVNFDRQSLEHLAVLIQRCLENTQNRAKKVNVKVKKSL